MPRRPTPPPAPPPPRRKPGSGSLTHRADRDTWLVRYKTRDGTTLSRSLTTRELAEQQLAAWVAADSSDETALAQRTLASWAEEWLATHVAVRNRRGTQRIYRAAMRTQIVPHLGSVRLADLTTQHVRRWHQALSGRYSPSTIGLAHTCLRRSLQVLVDDGVLARNPCTAAAPPPPTADGFEAQPLALSDARRVLDAVADTPDGPCLALLLWTGLRISEALGLRWTDVDLERGLLTVQQQVLVVPRAERTTTDWWEVGPIKSGKPRRVPLSSPALAALAQQRERVKQLRIAAPRWRELGLIFVTADGTPVGQRRLNYVWQRLRAQLGLPRTRIHDLRHTTAALALDAGAPLIEVSRLLGHNSTAITDRIYAGLLEDAQRRVADRLADHVRGAKRGPKRP